MTRAGLVLLLVWSGLAWCAGTPDVAIVLSERGGAYLETAEAVRAELAEHEARGVKIHLVTAAEVGAAAPRPAARIVVAVGTLALQAAVDSGTEAPLLAVLVPKAAHARIVAAGGRREQKVSAVYLDQPLGRQLDLLRLALPARRRVGALFGDESAALAPALRFAASERGVPLASRRVAEPAQLYPALQELLAEADVILALPDRGVYVSATVENILYTAYLSQVPLAGFSAAYVKAGALLAVYSTPAQMGAQAGAMARAVLTGQSLPPAQAPREFTVAVNHDVARALGLHVDAADILTKELRKLERKP